MANANLFQQYLQPVRSMTDYAADLDKAEGMQLALQGQRRQNELSALTADQTRQTMASSAEDRNALQSLAATWGADTTIDQRVASLRNSGRPALMQQADALEKQGLEKQKTGAEVSEKTSKVMDETIKRYRGALDFIDTPEGAARWLQSQYADPVLKEHMQALGPYEQAVLRIPSDPKAFGDWRAKAGIGMEKFLEHQAKQQEFGLKANNELIGPDGKINQTLLGAKKQVAQAGASSVNVNTGQKGFDNELKLRGDFKQEPVYKAHQEMQSAYSQIKQSLAQASPAGDLAGATKIMKLLDPGSVVRESELGMAMAATGLLDRVQNYASNIISGNKLTPKQRQEFQQLADALYGESVKAYNSKRGEYQKLGSEYGLNADRAVGAPASLAQRPSGGATQTSGQAPKAGTIEEGHRFKGGDPSNPSNWEKVK